MAFARDQVSTSSGANATSVSVSFNTLPNANSFIVFCVWHTNGSFTPTVSDSSGNNYYSIWAWRFPDSNVAAQVFYTNYKLKLPGAAPLTITASTNAIRFWGAQAASYTHTSKGTFLPDTQAINDASGSAAGFSYAGGTPLTSAELLVSVMGQNAFGSSEGVRLDTVSGQAQQFSLVGTPINDGSQFEVGGMADLISTDSASKSIFWDWSAGDSTDFASIIVPFYLQSFPIDVVATQLQAVNRSAVR